MPARSDIIAEALSWEGTRFHPQASAKGAGADCMGLIVGVARELGLPAADSAYSRMMADHNFRFTPRLLKKGLRETFDPVTKPSPGDVLLLRLGGKAQHLAIMTAPNKMIHTYGAGPGKVIEVPMGKPSCEGVWWDAIDSAWAWRGVE